MASNHFIEIGSDDYGDVWITVHSGSRNPGLRVANYYKDIAKNYCSEFKRDFSEGMSYLEGEMMDEYLTDMLNMISYAATNRMFITSKVLEFFEPLGASATDIIDSIHNFVDTEAKIIRKGATPARDGQYLIIPINMRDGSLICVGKGNEDWNCSAPHGAGRKMSRREAKDTLDVSDFELKMRGVWCSGVSSSSIDESPMAYKDMRDITDFIGETATIVNRIIPMYVAKSSGSKRRED